MLMLRKKLRTAFRRVNRRIFTTPILVETDYILVETDYTSLSIKYFDINWNHIFCGLEYIKGIQLGCHLKLC